MARYAADTSVSTERSRSEIESILGRYGADEFAYATKAGLAVVAFVAHGRKVRFNLPLPDKEQFRATPGGRRHRSDADCYRAWEQACRQRWRALTLAIKAKLEAVECGITTFEAEFLAHIMLPSGETVGEWATPQIERTYATGKMPPLLTFGVTQ